MKLSIGIVTFNRPACLAKLLESFANIDISVEHEVCILDNGSTVSPAGVIENFYSPLRGYKQGSVQKCVLSKNLGFAGGWNVLENFMSGEYRLMMQDDTQFVHRNKRADLRDVIKFMERSDEVFMSISDCSEAERGEIRYGNYSDWPHLEHSSLRQQQGDYRAFPRHFSSLREQGAYFEGDFAGRLAHAQVRAARYPFYLADHQRGGHSLMQTLLHEAGKVLSGPELEALWDHPTEEEFRRLGLKVWE